MQIKNKPKGPYQWNFRKLNSQGFAKDGENKKQKSGEDSQEASLLIFFPYNKIITKMDS